MRTGAAPEVEETFELVPLAGGVHSLRSRTNGQTFHPVVGPVVEAERLHVGGTRLVGRANALALRNEDPLVWDVGLGAAANALAAVRALAAGYEGEAPVHLYSFDRSFAALEFALANAQALQYPLGHEATLRALLERGAASVRLKHSFLTWQMCLADFQTVLTDDPSSHSPHAVFYDPYSPTVNPEMWKLELFTALRARLDDNRPCLLTNYTRSTAVRVTLLLAGFHVGVGPSTGEKDETTLATNAPTLLERPLTRDWLEKKVYASTNAAPLRAGAADERGPIREEDFARLWGCRQFCD